MNALARIQDDWSQRWPALARAAGIAPDEKLLLALSGGADSVLLLHWLAASVPPVALRAAHVDHGLRGEESAADARFVAELCASLGVPLRVLRAELDPAAPNLEARARAERYRLLAAEARASGHRTVLTGHHSDDALETVLMRWARGTELPGLRGPRRELVLRGGAGEGPVRVVRPLGTLRREEVRALLAGRGLAWRDDSSNADPRFTRSRARHGFLPFLGAIGGAEALHELREFSRAVEDLESEFARATAHIVWRPAPFAAATRGPHRRDERAPTDGAGPGGLRDASGGVLPRRELATLARPLARRVLWRLLTEGTGAAPSRTVVERAVAELAAGRTGRHDLAGGWKLVLRARELVLVPPRPRAALDAIRAADLGAEQPWLPFPSRGPAALAPRRDPPPAFELSVPGDVRLPDGRRIAAERVEVAPDADVPRSATVVELDARGLDGPLAVRFPVPGDRFRALGAPGSRRLVRFLADRGVPREERAHVPLVLAGVAAGAEIVWVAGIAPCEARRVGSGCAQRIRLTLHA